MRGLTGLILPVGDRAINKDPTGLSFDLITYWLKQHNILIEVQLACYIYWQPLPLPHAAVVFIVFIMITLGF